MLSTRPLEIFLVVLASLPGVQAADLEVLRLPDPGRIPDAALDSDSRLHVVYGAGARQESDVFYVRADRPGGEWTKPTQVNSQSGSLILGGERGPRIALGKGDVIHVLWQGRDRVWYSRSTDAGATWSEERNLVDQEVGIDSPALASDGAGNVWALWLDGRTGEDPGHPVSSTLFVARSTDDGASWSANAPTPYRACACCSLHPVVDGKGRLLVPYRGAAKGIRDVFLLEADSKGEKFQAAPVSDDSWRMDGCPMDGPIVSADAGGKKVVVAWQSDGEIYLAGSTDRRKFSARSAPGTSGGGSRIYASACLGPEGRILFAWAEDGEVAWEVRDKSGRVSRNGRESGLPNRSRFTTFAGPDGTFYLLY